MLESEIAPLASVALQVFAVVPPSQLVMTEASVPEELPLEEPPLEELPLEEEDPLEELDVDVDPLSSSGGMYASQFAVTAPSELTVTGTMPPLSVISYIAPSGSVTMREPVPFVPVAQELASTNTTLAIVAEEADVKRGRANFMGRSPLDAHAPRSRLTIEPFSSYDVALRSGSVDAVSLFVAGTQSFGGLYLMSGIKRPRNANTLCSFIQTAYST